MVREWRWLLLLSTLAFASAFVDFRIRQFEDYAYTTYIPGVIDGTYGAPGIYRVLVPFANTWLVELAGWTQASVWHSTRLIWFFLAFLAFFAYLRHWVDSAAAFSGVAVLAAFLPLTYTNSWAHPDSVPELALSTLACLAMVRRQEYWFGLWLILAALNRETAGFLVLAYAVSRPMSRRHLLKTLCFGITCGVVLGGLRVWRGIEHYDYWQLRRNIGFLGLLPPGYDPYKRAYAWFGVALAAPALAVIASRWSEVPATARRLLASSAPFVLTAVTLSSIIETRIFTLLFPLVAPALMCSVVKPKRNVEE